MCSFYNVNAQITSYSTNDTIQIDIVNDPNITFSLDFNQDGINDMAVQQSSGDYSSCFIHGVTNSSDVLHEYYYFGMPGNSISGHNARNMTDSTISDNSDWMVILQTSPSSWSGNGTIYSTNSNYVSNLLDQNFYMGVRFFVEGDDLIFRPNYACVDASLSMNGVFTIHGWSYETHPNTPITCTESLLIDVTGVSEISNQNHKTLIKIVDTMGRETPFRKNTVLIYIYSDGTTERVMEFE